MEPLELKEADEVRFNFSPLGTNFLKSTEWDGAFTDTSWLWPWVKPHGNRIIKAGILFLISTLITVAIPRLIAQVIDKVLVEKTAPFAFWFQLLTGLILCKIGADISYKWMITKIGQSITKRLRNDVFFQLGAYPLAFFDRNSSGRLISRCVNDVTNLSAFFTANFFTVIADFGVIIGSVIFMFSLSLKAGLVVLVTLVPMTVYMLNVSQAQMRWGRSLRNILSRLSSHTGDTMNNLAVLHSQSFSPKWIRRHERLQRQFSSLTIRNILTWGTFSSLHVLVLGVTYALVISLGVYELKRGEISIGSLIATFTYVGLIFGPFFEISEKLNTLVMALGSVKRLRDLLPEKLALAPGELSNVGSAPHGDVRFDGISFSYRLDVMLFEGFDLVLPEGEVTALVGRTGSGKTTLAHLMLGLYPLQSGSITWGDEDITTMGPGRRARWIGHVSQDLFIFTDSLRENLRLWREDIGDTQILGRLELVGLKSKIEALPGGLDYIVKAETLPLSQGEKQLLLLCRALLQDPRLLVFDEATASLDQLTEEEWLKHVAKLFQGRTTLFIAHRLETLRLATHIVVLRDGKIAKTIRKRSGVPVSEDMLEG